MLPRDSSKGTGIDFRETGSDIFKPEVNFYDRKYDLYKPLNVVLMLYLDICVLKHV